MTLSRILTAVVPAAFLTLSGCLLSVWGGVPRVQVRNQTPDTLVALELVGNPAPWSHRFSRPLPPGALSTSFYLPMPGHLRLQIRDTRGQPRILPERRHAPGTFVRIEVH